MGKKSLKQKSSEVKLQGVVLSHTEAT